MKKIAFFMHNFNGGGAEKVTLKTVEGLMAHGYDVTMIMRENIGELKNCIPDGIHIIDLKINNKSKIIKNISNIKKLNKVLKKEKFDIVFGVTFNMSLILALSSFYDTTKLIAIMHNTISYEKHRFMRIRKIIMNLVSKKFKKIVFVSNGARKDYIDAMKIDESKTITIYNPVVSEEIIEKSLQKTNCDWIDNKGDYKVIINIGRLTAQKNQKMLLKAIKIVSKKEKIRLIILGDGELKDELQNLAKKENINDIVKFWGFTNNPYAFLSKSDLFVLSSNYEGLPTVLIEALACGCKIVSTDCPTGPKEILDNGNYGKLVELNDENKMASAICEVLQEEKINKSFIMNRAQLFTIKKAIDEYISLIEM